MKNTIHPPYRKLKLLVILPLIAGVFYAFAIPEYKYANGNEDQKPIYSITQDRVEIPFTNQMTKADLEAIKAELANVGMEIDYTALDYTNEGKLKTISATVKYQGGSVSWNSYEISATAYPVFKKEPTGGFGIYFSTSVKGTVYNEKGAPLPRVAVIVNGSNGSIGTITNEAGEFELKGITQNENIVFSYVGYQSAVVKAEAGRQMIINMTPANIAIDQVTVTGHENNSAQSSLGSTIKIQANSPLKFRNADGSSAQPLFVIDGVITDHANINNISPETVESISILKDASATALYGEKGKNGVILITKKKESSATQNNLIDVNISQDAKTQKDEVYTEVEEMPEFPGGIDALKQWLVSNVRYPKVAHDQGIQGKVFVSFVVTSTGSVTDAKILRGVDPSLDQEALRVANSMPLWKPGKQGGKVVSVQFTIPINFVLEPAQTATKEGKDNVPYTVVEQMPEFPGGFEALKAFITSSMKYPTIALENGIEGQVIASFIVDKTGKIPSVKILRGVDPSLDQEVLRIINSMPKWNPGMQNGEAVDVTFTLPIDFKIPEDYKRISREKLKTPYNESHSGKLVIVPNPTKSRATITLEGTDSTNKLQVSIIDSYGKMIVRETKNGPSFTLSVSSLTPGTYRVVAVDGNKQYQGSLVVNH